MPNPKSSWQEQLTQFIKEQGAGLLGKLTPVYLAAFVFAGSALALLPEDFKGNAFWLGAATLAIYSLLAAFIVVVHPILGTMEGETARKALRDNWKARHSDVIEGSTVPKGIGSPAAGLAGSAQPMAIDRKPKS